MSHVVVKTQSGGRARATVANSMTACNHMTACICVCVRGQAAGGLGGPRASATHGEFLLPGSHSWLQPGREIEGSVSAEVSDNLKRPPTVSNGRDI